MTSRSNEGWTTNSVFGCALQLRRTLLSSIGSFCYRQLLHAARSGSFSTLSIQKIPTTDNLGIHTSRYESEVPQDPGQTWLRGSPTKDRGALPACLLACLLSTYRLLSVCIQIYLVHLSFLFGSRSNCIYWVHDTNNPGLDAAISLSSPSLNVAFQLPTILTWQV